MRNNILVLALIVLFLSGCASLGNIDRLRSRNRQNLMKLQIGTTKEEVLNVMGTKSVADYNWLAGWKHTVDNPYRSEILRGKDKTLEVIYYLTDIKKANGAITDDELTPFVFDNDKLIGWGWSFLQDTVQKYEIRFR